MPVWSSRSHRSVLPLRGVAQTRYERVGMGTGGSESIGSVELLFGVRAAGNATMGGA